MDQLIVQVVEIELEPLAPLGLGRNVGAALRGALFESLRWNLNVCLYKHLPSCVPCSLRHVCPLAGLLATVDDDAVRGHDAPRPMTIEPPLGLQRTYPVGSRLRFTLTLLGAGTRYLPYVVLAARELERSGLGRRLDGPAGETRGRAPVRLGRVSAIHPFSGARETIRAPGDDLIRPSSLVVTSADVESFAATLPADAITLDLLTPLRLVEGGRLVHPLRFDALIWRLHDRLTALCRHHAAGGEWIGDSRTLVERARAVRVARDATTWLDLEAHSSRTGRWSPTGGYVGWITFQGELAPFRSLLVWGSLVHVGKSATRGNGWYRVRAPAIEQPTLSDAPEEIRR
jgi:hypothetical protein